jgi:hypothetical protein
MGFGAVGCWIKKTQRNLLEKWRKITDFGYFDSLFKLSFLIRRDTVLMNS